MAAVCLSNGVTFECENESILDAALVADVFLPFSCRRGDCDSCQCILLEGSVSQLGEVKNAGDTILTCQAEPLSDCAIDSEALPQLADLRRTTFPAKVTDIGVNGNTAVIKFRTPPAIKFKFLEGQYIDLIIGGVRRSYSIANTSEDGFIELHVKKVINGVMSAKVFDELVEGALVRIDGPIGSFFVRDYVKPLIFLATGTGFAPVKAMVNNLIEKGFERDIRVYWGNRQLSDFYTDIPLRWQESIKNITYIPVLSREDHIDNIRQGYVQDAVIEDLNKLDGYDVYACGSSLMIGSAKTLFLRNGLSAKNFYSDAFVATTNL